VRAQLQAVRMIGMASEYSTTASILSHLQLKVSSLEIIHFHRENRNKICMCCPLYAEPCRDLNRPLDDVLEVLVQKRWIIRSELFMTERKRPALARRREYWRLDDGNRPQHRILQGNGILITKKKLSSCACRWYLTLGLELP